MENLYVFDIASTVFMVKNYSDYLHSIKNTGKDLTLKQMFDVSGMLITEQSDEIYGVNTINWSDSAWKHLSLIVGEEVVSLSREKVYVFSDSVLCLGKMSENPLSNIVWEDELTWFKSSSPDRALDKVVKYLPRITALQLCYKVQEFMSKSAYNQRISLDGLSSSEKKWNSTLECKPQGEWDRVAELIMLTFAERKHPVFRSTSPVSRGVLKSKGGGKLLIHYCADQGTIDTFFRTIISGNQFSIHGAVSEYV